MPKTPFVDMIEARRRRVEELHLADRTEAAIALQVELVNDAITHAQARAEDFHRLGLMLFAVRDFSAAATAFAEAKRRQPGLADVSLNLGLSLIRAGRHRDGLEQLLQIAENDSSNVSVLDGLADAYGKLGELENARLYGERALLAKDRAANAPAADFVMKGEPPPLRIDRPSENIISFSLFGAEQRFLSGAIKNATLSPDLYPGWSCRFYCDDTVPRETSVSLEKLGAEVKMMPRHRHFADGLFWRFLVSDDPRVARFLIRDCDAVINIRERLAVDEWLARGCFFHVMRDHTSHTALMLAGMWGGVAGILPSIPALLREFAYNPVTGRRTADQLFLGQIVWPMIKQSCLVHDRIYRVLGAEPFPPGARLPTGQHVGANVAATGGESALQVAQR